MSNTEAMRADFEAEVKQYFDTNDNSFNLDPSSGKYYGNVSTKTFGGRIPPNYAPVAMMFYCWQVATVQATAGMKDRLLAALERAAAAETSLREEVEQERERCAKLCEKRSSRRRIIYAGANQNPIAPCEFAEAIRRGSL